MAVREQQSFYQPLFAFARTYSISEETAIMSVADLKVHGQLCSRLNLTPVAGNKLIKEILELEFKKAAKLLPTNQTQRAAETMFSYEVPGIKGASISSIIALRNNEDAFNEWRRNFWKNT